MPGSRRRLTRGSIRRKSCSPIFSSPENELDPELGVNHRGATERVSRANDFRGFTETLTPYCTK